MTLSPELTRDPTTALRASLPGLCRWCKDGAAVKDGGESTWYHHWINAKGESCWSRCEASVLRTLLARVEEEVERGE